MTTKKMYILGLVAFFCAMLSLARVDLHAQTLKERFVELASIPSVTGHEAELANYIEKKLQGVTLEKDNMGSLIARFGTGDVETLILTSIDEPGYIVSGIRDDGYLTVQMPSRVQYPLLHQFHEGHIVDIMTDRGAIRGVVAIPSSHITRGKGDLRSLTDFIVDIGARSKSEALSYGVKIIDPISAIKDVAILHENKVSGPFLGNKIGAFALLEALQSEKPNNSIAVVWATKGMRRNSGAMRIAQQIKPKNILLVTAYSPQINRRTGTKRLPVSALGSGVLIPDNMQSNTFSKKMMNYLSAKNHIPSFTGNHNELRPFMQINNGVNIIPVAIPVKNPGSLVETIDLNDLELLIELVKHIASN